MRHLIDPLDFSQQEIASLLDLADRICADPTAYQNVAEHKKLATLFVQGKESHRAVSNQIFDVIHGILVKIFNPEGEKLFPVIQKTVRRYEELRQKEEELQGLIDDGAGTWIFASGKTGDSENCL